MKDQDIDDPRGEKFPEGKPSPHLVMAMTDRKMGPANKSWDVGERDVALSFLHAGLYARHPWYVRFLLYI